MTPPLDLTAAIHAFGRAEKSRRDEDLAHVSDLYGCRRAAWARRGGEPRLVPSPETKIKFALGQAVEDFLVPRLRDLGADGWELLRNVRVALDAEGHGRVLRDDEKPDDAEIVGHADYVLEHEERGLRALVEVKSTTFYPRINKQTGRRERELPDHASPWYVTQAAAYALALDAPWFCILVVCRESGMIAEFWHETSRYATEIRALVADVLKTTDPSCPEPPAIPPPDIAKWACGYCAFAACEKNTNTRDTFPLMPYEEAV